jgi:hypothetical protein
MSQAPPPSGGYPAYPPSPPSKRRPSGWWFVLGGGLIVAAVVAGIGLFIWTLSSFLETDAEVPADGQEHIVSVGTDDDRLLWLADGGGQSCSIFDNQTGQPVEDDDVDGSFNRSDSDGAWHGVASFDPGSGDLTVSCDGGGTVLIGPAPQFGSFFAGVAATILVPLGLGFLGLAIVITTGVLWAIRPARQKT